jgi:hypothetical protein
MRPNPRTPSARTARLAIWWLLPLISVLFFLGASPRDAHARPTGHPIYNDGGTLRWYASFQEARTVAAKEGKLILVDLCPPRNRACGSVIGLIGERTIRDRVARVAIGHHLDSRSRSPLVRTMRANLPREAYLPWLGFFTPESAWVSGFAPSRRTSRAEMQRRLLRALGHAEAKQRQIHAARKKVATAAAPRVSSTREGSNPRTSSTREGPTAAATSPPRQPRTSSASPAGGVFWHKKISEARAAARAEGKMILVTSTKPSCSLCKKLRNKVIPQIKQELSKGCVFYVYDITRPENGTVDRLVRAKLPNARLMPLSGFMTADMRWLHGFFGGTDTRQLMGDYRTALRKR